MGAASNEVALRFGENMRRIRRGAGISQEALGFRASLHRTEIGLLERGERTPRIDTLVKLATSLGASPGELLDGISWNPGSVIEVAKGGFGIADPDA
jgi:transcriptional regulator with XRE-family HTH domain